MCIGWTKKRNTVYNNIFFNSKGKKRKETSIVSTGVFLQAGTNGEKRPKMAKHGILRKMAGK